MPLLPFRSKPAGDDLDVSVRDGTVKQHEAESPHTARSDGPSAGGKGFMSNTLRRRLLMREFPVIRFHFTLCVR
jgi:hypothetical protein